MNQVRNSIKRDFTQIPNSLINDNSLSDRARFIFCYMAAKPDNWKFYQDVMAKDLKMSLDTVRKYLSELVKSGWIGRESNRSGKGTFDSFIYTLNSQPCGKNTESVKNGVGKKPSRKNSALNNNIPIITNTDNNNYSKGVFVETSSTGFLDQDEIEQIEQDIYNSKATQENPTPQVARTPRPKTKAKKENPDAAPTAEMWDQYVEAYQRVSKGETPISQTKDFVALSKLYKALHEKAVAKKPDFIPESKTYLWEVFLKQVEKLVQNPGEGWLHDNFTPSIFWSQFNTIMLKINSTQSKKSVVVPLFRQEDYRNVDRRNFKF